MSANINSLAYAGEAPWHGLGTKVEGLMTSAEALEKGGLDWGVEKRPLLLSDGRTVPAYATVRTDTNDILGVVGTRYTVLQNKDGFRFFDAIVGIKEAIYETVGALGKGEKVWLLAKLPGYVKTTKEDVTEKYLLLSNSHDGKAAIEVMFTPIRVVCQNTLNVAVSASTNRISLRHTRNIGNRIDEIQHELGIINQRFSIFEEASQKLSTVQLTKEAFENYLKNSGIVQKNLDENDRSSRSKNILDTVTGLFEGYGKGSKLDGSKGTVWGAFNAVAEYVDHHRGKDLKKRANSLLFGSGALLKQKAWNEALELAK